MPFREPGNTARVLSDEMATAQAVVVSTVKTTLPSFWMLPSWHERSLMVLTPVVRL